MAERLKKRAVRFSLFVAILSPVAVVLLAVQIIAFPEAGAVSTALIAGELAALAFVLLLGVIHLSAPPDVWVNARLRAEIFRREVSLARTRVGPYLHCMTASDLEAAMRRRVLAIEDEETDPVSLLSLEDAGGQAWDDELEDCAPDYGGELEPGCIETYLRERVSHQRKWFTKRSRESGRCGSGCEAMAVGALVAGVIVAAMHLTVLWVTAGGPPLPTAHFIEIAAIVLPPLGSMASGIHSVLQGRSLSRSYATHGGLLVPIEQRLVTLQSVGEFPSPTGLGNADETPVLSEAVQADLLEDWPDIVVLAAMADRVQKERRGRLLFKRLVLHVEEVLSSELRYWSLTMRTLSTTH